MSDNNVTYVINVNGDAAKRVQTIAVGADTATQKMSKLCTVFQKFSFISFGMQQISKAFSNIKNSISSLEQVYQVQHVAETKLQQVMRNTIGATDEQIQSVKDLAEEQQKLGVIGNDIQIAGAQELATYVSKTESIKKLLPAMNDMLAQQYGINASQEQAANIASMMGKVLDGQTGALSRYGYKFSKAEENVLKYGKEAARVKVLAKIIDESVGGVNKALSETPEGKMKQVANNMEDAKARLGKFITVTKNAFYPVFQTILEKINKVGDWFEMNQERISAVITKIANAISTAVNWVWNSILWVKDATISAFEWIKQAIQKVGNFFVWLGEKIRSLYPIIISVISVIGSWYIKTHLLTRAKYILWWQVNLLKRDILTLRNNIIKTTTAIWAKITSVWSAVSAMGVWGTITWAVCGAMGALKIAINAVSKAIYSIPIIGWIAAGVSLLIGIFKLLWEKCEGFRRLIFGVWEVVKTFFTGLGGLFTSVWSAIKGFFSWTGEKFSALWNWIKNVGQNIADFFTGVFSSVGGFFSGIWDHISGFFSWLWSIFAKVGTAIKKAFQPLLDFFSNLWDFVKKIFTWILDKMTAIFNPIIQLWNKLTGKTVEIYKKGADKGSESFRKSQKEKIGASGISDPSIPGVSDLKSDNTKAPGAVTKGAEATATGGTRNTTINIHMGKFFDNMVFNGSVSENAKDIERKMEEVLLRVLYAAQNAG